MVERSDDEDAALAVTPNVRSVREHRVKVALRARSVSGGHG